MRADQILALLLLAESKTGGSKARAAASYKAKSDYYRSLPNDALTPPTAAVGLTGLLIPVVKEKLKGLAAEARPCERYEELLQALEKISRTNGEELSEKDFKMLGFLARENPEAEKFYQGRFLPVVAASSHKTPTQTFQSTEASPAAAPIASRPSGNPNTCMLRDRKREMLEKYPNSPVSQQLKDDTKCYAVDRDTYNEFKKQLNLYSLYIDEDDLSHIKNNLEKIKNNTNNQGHQLLGHMDFMTIERALRKLDPEFPLVKLFNETFFPQVLRCSGLEAAPALSERNPPPAPPPRYGH